MNTNHSTSKLQVLAYERLSSYFSLHDNHIIEIEVLPPSIEPPDGFLLIDEFNLGIPKKILALAYIEARKQFFKHVNNQDSRSIALKASKVMLLFDPEHLTAGNFRKRHLIALKAGGSTQDQAVYRKAIKYEFCFLDSILTSPLHRQTKSPNLWYHRLWLLNLLCPSGLDNASKEDRTEFAKKELYSTFKSGQQHPKNYYAWQYARRLMGKIGAQDVALDFAHCVKDWCCKHPSDISGWTFLSHVLLKIEPTREKQDLVRSVVNYAINLRSENESVWVFIRVVLTDGTLEELGRTELIGVLRECIQNLAETEQATKYLQFVTSTLSWVDTFGKRRQLAPLDSIT